MNDLVEKIKDNLDIVDIINEYVALNTTGSNYKGLCPFHSEKTPSFIVSPAKQIFHCFGCGAGGDVFKFYSLIENISYKETFKILAKKAGVTLKYKSNEKYNENDIYYKINKIALKLYTQNLKNNTTAVKYLKERGISEETIVLFNLGFALDSWDTLKNKLVLEKIKMDTAIKSGLIIHNSDKNSFYDRFRNRIIFPIFNNANKPIAFGGRTLSKMDKQTAKYINSPETPIYHKSNFLYGLNLSKKYIIQNDYVIIVEGYVDLLICFQFGFKNVVASLGTALTKEHIKILSRYTKNIIFIYDGDAAGVAAMSRGIQVMLANEIFPKVVVLDKNMDPADALLEYGEDFLVKKIENAVFFLDFELNNLMNKYDSNSPTGKKNIVSEFAKHLSFISDNIILAEYIKKLSMTLKIKFELLSKELLSIIKKVKRKENISDSFINIAKIKEYNDLDASLLQFLIYENDFELVEVLKQNISLSLITSPYKELLAVILKLKSLDVKKLLNYYLDNAEITNLITKLALKEKEYNSNESNKVLMDKIKLLKKREIKNINKDLSQEIYEMSSSKNKMPDYENRVIDILKEKLNLLKITN